jgi:hypothetical protein
MAVDKQQIIDVALLGLGTPGLTFVPTGLGPWFADGVEDHPFDLEAAAALLDSAGYLDSDGDGVRECRADQSCDDLTFRLNYATDIDTAPRGRAAVELVGRDRRRRSRSRASTRTRSPPCAARTSTTTSSSGGGSATPIRASCSASRCVTRSTPASPSRATATRATTRCSRAGGRDRPRRTHRAGARDAADPDRRPALHRDLLRAQRAGLPQRPVHRLARFRALADRTVGQQLTRPVIRPVD